MFFFAILLTFCDCLFIWRAVSSLAQDILAVPTTALLLGYHCQPKTVYFTVVQRVSPFGNSRRTRCEPVAFWITSLTVPVTPDFGVVNDEPIVMFFIFASLFCVVVICIL